MTFYVLLKLLHLLILKRKITPLLKKERKKKCCVAFASSSCIFLISHVGPICMISATSLF